MRETYEYEQIQTRRLAPNYWNEIQIFQSKNKKKKIVFNEKCKMADAYADFWNFK